ncbi:ATP synthase I chain, partial [Dysosmobacter welbionis]
WIERRAGGGGLRQMGRSVHPAGAKGAPGHLTRGCGGSESGEHSRLRRPGVLCLPGSGSEKQRLLSGKKRSVTGTLRFRVPWCLLWWGPPVPQGDPPPRHPLWCHLRGNNRFCTAPHGHRWPARSCKRLPSHRYSVCR